MPLKVVQALPALEVGGVERGTLEVARALVDAGHESLVISSGGRLVKKLTESGSRHIDWPIGKKSLATLSYVNRLKNFLVAENVNVVHARSRLPAWIVWLAIRGLPHEQRPAFVTTVHGPYSVNAYSGIMCRGVRVIAISKFIHDYILSNYPDTDPGRIRIIHRGVDNEEFPYNYQPSGSWLNNWQQEHKELEDRFVITAPARITRWKGQEDFIDIIAGLRQADIPAHGLIAGGAHPKKTRFLESLKDKTRSLGLEQHISFLGHRDDLKNIMAISDVVVSLAREPEAFGRTALEALCLGKPVIAYAHGGAAEVLQKMYQPGMVEPLNIDQAIERAASLYQNRTTPDRQNPFTRQNMLDKTLQVYSECAS